MPGIPNKHRAIITGKIATYHNGKRIVRRYQSGEPLIGTLQSNDCPPYTGYVRNFGKRESSQKCS